MKMPIMILIIIGIVFSVSTSYSQDRTLNGFTAGTMFTSDSGFIENRFGFKQVFLTEVPVSHDVEAFAMGERVSMDIKLHDYVGISGKLSGTFQIGGDSIIDDYQFSGGYKVRTDGNIDLKLLRSEKLGTQWIFHIKTTYQYSEGFFADTSRLSSEFDKSHYLFLEYQDRIDIDDLTEFINEDVKTLVKNNATNLVVSTQHTFVGGGASLSWLQVINPNMAILASASAIIGDDTVEISNVKLLPLRYVQSNLGVAACFSLHPITPITLRAELEHESSIYGTNNLALGSVVYSKEHAPTSVTISAGKYFLKDKSTPIGSVTVDLYF